MSLFRGEVVWGDYPEGRGHEQTNDAGRPRPYVILSDDLLLARSGLVVACPITSNATAGPNGMRPFRLPISPDMVITRGSESGLEKPGLVLCEQLRVMDAEKRFSKAGQQAPVRYKKLGKLTPQAMLDVERKVQNVLRLRCASPAPAPAP